MPSNVKVAVVSGSNKGIGFAIVKGLCEKFNGDVFLTARNEDLGKEAVKSLEEKGFHPKFHQLDIDDINSIKRFKDFIKKEYDGLDILVNNAGMAYTNASTAPVSEQAENTVRVNFFATLNVCKELFPLLRPHARVVNVSSSCGMLYHLKDDALKKQFCSPTLTEEQLCSMMTQYVDDTKTGEYTKKGYAPSTYMMSKIGVTALSVTQQKAFDKDDRSDLIVNAVHPGYVDTDMSSHKGSLTIEQGAEAPLYAALLEPNVTSPKGEMIWNDKTIAKWAV